MVLINIYIYIYIYINQSDLCIMSNCNALNNGEVNTNIYLLLR